MEADALVRQLQNINYAGSFFQKALQDAKTSQACSLCRRDLDDHELSEFTDRVTLHPIQKKEI
jgi:hypothetical protein